jgi:hypothetical protein
MAPKCADLPRTKKSAMAPVANEPSLCAMAPVAGEPSLCQKIERQIDKSAPETFLRPVRDHPPPKQNGKIDP